MADVSVRMGVSGIGQFKQAMNDAQNSVRTIDAALKKNEAQFKATGNAQDYLGQKTDLLKQKLNSQKTAAANASQALAQMAQNGVDPASREYQKLAQSLLNAETAVIETQTQIQNLGTQEEEATGKTEKLEASLQGLNKKVSLQQVIHGIDSITSGLEKAAKKAVEVGTKIWDNIMDSAAYADDTATLASRMGLTVEEVQQMQYVANRFEAPVETVAKSWKKIKMSMTSDSKDIIADFERLGVATVEYAQGKLGPVAQGMRDYKDVFWETGEAIMRITDEAEQERLAQQLLGRSWDELIPLFKAGREAYEEALESAPTNSEDAIENAAELNDKISELEQSFKILKTEVIGNIAPALSAAADSLEKLIKSITEYLQTDEGQEMLQKMGEAVEGLFSDLSKIDPEEVVEGFASVFNTIVDGLKWLSDNSGTVIGAMQAIVAGWGALKITGGVLKIIELVNGLKGLGGAKGVTDAMNQIANNNPGGGTGGSGTGDAAGTAGKTGFFAKIGSAIKGGWAANGAWGLAPAAVFGLSIAPALKLQSDIEQQTVDAYEAANEILDAAEEAGDTSKEMINLARQANEATMPNGYDTNRLGQINFGYNSKIDDAVKTFGSRAYEAMWKDLFARFYEYDNVNGWSIDALTRLARGEGVKDAFGETTYGIDQQTSDALATAMRDVLTQAIAEGYEYDPYKWSRTEIQRRELPSGWAYDEKGQIYNMETGKFMQENTTYWDDKRWMEWTNEQNAKYAEESSTAIQESAGKISDAADRMSTLPDAVAAAVSGITLSVEFSLFGGSHANGIGYVPFDGYMAMLHRGERVLTERENRNYSTVNNTYFGTVNLNNGLEVDALTESIDKRNRRQQAGYGA